MTTTQYPPAQPQPVELKNGAALASLILGIVSLVANLLLVPTILGIVFGVLGLKRAPARGRKGMAIAGIVLSVVGAVAGIAIFAGLMSVLGSAAASAADSLPSIAATADDAVEEEAAPSQAATDDEASAAEPAASDVPDGYKAVTDDVWFKWGKTDDSNQFLTTRAATVIVPNGCETLFVEANEYDADGTNVGSTYASASNLGAGDKAKLEFTWLDDDDVDSVKINDVTCF